jgi:hypothetical protein
MRVIPIGIAGLFLLLSSAIASAAQPSYDLKCQGNSSALDDSDAGSSPFAMTLHVDLSRNSFCQNSCETQEKISKVLPSNIIFRAVNAPLPNRLWVADSGLFSYTWADAPAHDEKPAVHSAQGLCTKVMTSAGIAVETTKQKPAVAAPKPVIAMQKPAIPPRAEELSATEIMALIDVQNHRPVPASMHTRLYSRGLVHLDNDLWVLTDKGEAIITGDKR